MVSPASKLIKKLNGVINGRKAPHRRVVKISTEQCLSDVMEHLQWLKSRHIKRTYSNEYLVSVCFQKPRNIKKDAEINAYCRVHLYIATMQFEALLKTMRGNAAKISFSQLQGYKDIINDYLLDLRLIVEHLERKKDKSYQFFLGGKTYHVHSREIFRISRQLAIQSAYRKTPFYIDHKTGQITAVVTLRQALEAKFERIVAVGIYDSSDQPPRLKHDFYYNFIKTHQQYFEFPSVDFSLLLKIYNWCSVIVHHTFQPLAWQLPYAHDCSAGLFSGGQFNQNGGWSINGGIRVLNLEDMREAFLEYFHRNYDHTSIFCIQYAEPEAVSYT